MPSEQAICPISWWVPTMGTPTGYALAPEVPPDGIAATLLYAVLFMDF